jgi:hypothetical protein
MVETSSAAPSGCSRRNTPSWGAYVFLAGHVGRRPQAVTVGQVRAALRTSFTRWGTLPDEVQTDGEAVLIGRPQDMFPSPFTLWLRGLGITHLRIWPGEPYGLPGSGRT